MALICNVWGSMERLTMFVFLLWNSINKLDQNNSSLRKLIFEVLEASIPEKGAHRILPS